MSKAILSKAILREADLSEADLNHATLRQAILFGADLCGADLIDANLHGANLSEVHLHGADLRQVTLYAANLSKADLREVHLYTADLRNATLFATNLNKADLRNANLFEVNLKGVYMEEAVLFGADLRGADLRQADLRLVNLSRADLNEADLSGTWIGGTTITEIDLRTTKGITEIEHRGPSPVALYAIQLPQDGSALHFLRGAGVPEEWIDDYRVHMMHPIQYYSVFICYTHKDDLLARRLHNDLQANGVRCWFAPEDMKIGDRMRTRIDEAIHVQDKLLLLLSAHALASNWVEDEIEAALEKEQQQQRKVLFPIRLDDQVMLTSKAWMASLRRMRSIGDFTRWTDPTAYQQAFEQLLRDLKVETAKPQE